MESVEKNESIVNVIKKLEVKKMQVKKKKTKKKI